MVHVSSRDEKPRDQRICLDQGLVPLVCSCGFYPVFFWGARGGGYSKLVKYLMDFSKIKVCHVETCHWDLSLAPQLWAKEGEDFEFHANLVALKITVFFLKNEALSKGFCNNFEAHLDILVVWKEQLSFCFGADRYHTFCIHLDAVPEGDWYCHRHGFSEIKWHSPKGVWFATLIHRMCSSKYM